MHSRTWLVGISVTIAALLGCKIGGDDLGAGTSTKTAAEALSKSVEFENGELIEGLMPPGTETDVVLSPLAGADVQPGDTALMAFDLDNPDDANEALLALIEFTGAADHFEVDIAGGAGADAGAADGGTAPKSHFELAFDIDPAVCDKLCDTTYEIKVKQAVKLKNKKVSKHATGSITLDCRETGNHALCGDANKTDAGTTEPAAGAGAKLLAAYAKLEQDICECAGGGSTCKSVATESDCVGKIFDAHLDDLGDQLKCMQDFVVEQQACVDDAACDTAKLAACDIVKNDNVDSMTGSNTPGAVEVACGALPTAVDTEVAACSDSAMTCDGLSLPASARCDGTRDCTDGSDEAGCVSSGPTSFSCSDGTILTSDKLCDGTEDCSDAVDEMVCNVCDDTAAPPLYSIYQICDGTEDCADARDEMDCTFTCTDQTTVPVQSLCDQKDDCADGSDEVCDDTVQFPCGDGVNTVPVTQKCDGVSDCPNGFDEASCGG